MPAASPRGRSDPNGAAASKITQFVPPGVVTESDALLNASLLRREPFRLFFPTGALLAWAGVTHWLLHALGLLGDYRPIFHAMTQIQGFLMSFAVGFLFTMIPRRTGSAPPSALQIAICFACVLGVSATAWCGRFALAQLAWLVLAATVVTFAVKRFVSARSKRRPPNSFVWIPLSFLMGVIGAVLTASFALLGPEYAHLHTIGKGLILQGMFTGLVLGVGGLAIPLMTRGQAPADAKAGGADAVERIFHVACALALLSSFWVESLVSVRGAYALRALVSLAALLIGAELWRPPTNPGANRRLIWLSAWMLPLGFALASAWPESRIAALHVVFIGGFAAMALAVSTQVTLGHGGDAPRLAGRPWQTLAIGVLLTAAMLARAMMALDPQHFFAWMAWAAIAFLAATLAWAGLVLPYFVRGQR